MSPPGPEDSGGEPGGSATERLFGAVLAGGDSTRFGGDKARAEVEGRPMAARALGALAPWVAARGVVVSADAPPGDRAGAPGVATRRDSRPGLGPLEGLRVALAWAREERCDGLVVLACDLPLVDDAVVGALVRMWRARGDDAPDGVVPIVSGRPQPLAAVYSTGVLTTVEARLADGRRSVTGMLEQLRVRRVPTGSSGLPAASFLNVNTPADAGRARAVLEDRPEPDPEPVGELGGGPSRRLGEGEGVGTNG